MLPIQLIYEGKTDRCHPNFKFPKGWILSHSESHWANTQTFNDFLVKILLPEVSIIREGNGKSDQKALLLIDVFRAHQDSESLQMLKDNQILVLFVPPNLTS